MRGGQTFRHRRQVKLSGTGKLAIEKTGATPQGTRLE
jgi:hypothetical protein